MENRLEKILEKLSSYNIFNYLLPGVVFCVISDKYLSVPLLQDSIINSLFLYYFVGLIISRFGSVAIEPILKKLRIIKFADYTDFISAFKNDPKIELLSEANNMYRTVLSVFIVLIFVAIGRQIIQVYPGLLNVFKYSILLGLALLFGLSYKKQTEYITKRVSENKKDSN